MWFRGVGAWVVCLCVMSLQLLAAPPALEGYSDHDAFTRQVRELAEGQPRGTLRSLAKTREGRDVWLLTVAGDENDKQAEAKPAVLIVGSAHAPHLLGSELAVRIARRLFADEEDAAELRRRFTFYIIPRPNPDAAAGLFQPPWHERALNARPMDNDNDGRIDEDGPDDLNGDGYITMMRIEDPTGSYMPHPDEARVLVEADPREDELGKYRLMVEGLDNDGDGEYNEDAPGGVDFNRNFPFDYPYFETGAGPHQVSEPESRAVADFALSRDNIALVLTFDPADNLMKAWRSEPSREQGEIKTRLLSSDAEYLTRVSEIYRDLQPLKDPPAAEAEGSFAQWAYFHYGRWSLAARGWWIPPAKPADAERKKDQAEDDEQEQDQEEDAKAEDKEKPERSARSRKDTRAADVINALRWLDEQDIDGFVAWTEIEHPGFKDAKVEVGGLKPLITLNPPAAELDDLADLHYKFISEAAGLLPELAIEKVKVELLGASVYRLTVTVVNRGYLPTAPEMGEVNEIPLPLQIHLEAPEGTAFLRGFPHGKVPRLEGRGGSAEHQWLIRTEADAVSITVHSPSVGRVSAEAQLK